MAAPKKKTPAKPKAKTTAPAKTAPAKKAPAASQDVIQDTIALIKGFQMYTLVALVLGLLFVIFQFFHETQFNWILNIAVAAISGYLFWRQGNETSAVEQRVCRYGLLAVVAVFLWRDINISQDLANFLDRYGSLNDLLP